MSNLIFLIILFALAVIYFILGIYASRKTENTTDYFLAGRKLGLLNVTFTLIATQLGGGMLLGTSQKAYEIGLFGILYTISITLGFLFLGLGFASKLQELHISTTAELFETKYQSITLRKFASLLSIITLCGILIAQVIASKAVLASIGIDNNIIFILFWIFIISYTIIGGLNAVVITDTAQVLLIILVFGGIFIYNILLEPNIFNTMVTFTANQKNFIFNRSSFLDLLPILIMPALFTLIEQDLAQKFFASKSKKVAAISSILAGSFMLIFALIPIYLGIKANLMGINIPANASPLISILKTSTNNIVFMFAVCGIIAAITSTADSLLCAVSSNLSEDFNFSFLRITNKLKLAKYITAIIGAFAIISSYFFTTDIINILVSSYELSVSCLFIPLVFSIYLKKPNKNSALLSIIFGLFSYILLKMLNVPLHGVISVIISAIGFFIGNLLKPQ
ncbi:MAG: sodium:solute symporter family protein [Candidatus Babeliales bacterium]|nr:sodium:solute symporter family protein [Candidatus Babeliales bacterium]